MSVFRAQNLLVGGSIYEQNKDHTVADVSGIMLYRIPRYMHPWYVTDMDIAVLPYWEEKIEQTARSAASASKLSLIGGVPTWVLTVLRKALEYKGAETIEEGWGGAQAYIHGGVDFRPYRPQFERLLAGGSCRFIEVYNATEGFFAYQDRPYDEGMLLMLASGIYYEFVAIQDYRSGDYSFLPVHEVNTDQSYVMFITTYTGLVRYDMKDVVRFVTIAPYRIKVEGRVGSYINAFGEDLMADQVAQAIEDVNQVHGVDIAFYTIAPSYITLDSKGRHDWLMECIKGPRDLAEYERSLDDKLRELNPNYDQKRSADLALECLKITMLPRGSFHQYFKARGKLGGQNKIKKLSNDRTLIEDIWQTLDQSNGR